MEPPKRPSFTGLHGITSQNKALFIIQNKFAPLFSKLFNVRLTDHSTRLQQRHIPEAPDLNNLPYDAHISSNIFKKLAVSIFRVGIASRFVRNDDIHLPNNTVLHLIRPQYKRFVQDSF
jgi:hypothetical protein